MKGSDNVNKVFLTINDVALLTGLKENSVLYNIKRGKYETITLPGKGQGGKQYYIALESLPEEAQERYREQNSSPAPLSIFSEEIMKKYSLKQRDKAIQRYNILREWERSGLNGQSFVRKYNEEHSDKLTYRKLEYWKQKERESGIVGLIDKRGGDFRQSDCMPPEVWDMFYSLYMTTQKRSIRICYDKTKAFFLKQYPNMKFPSYQTFTRKVREEIPEYAVIAYREGKKALADKMPYMQRDKSELHTNQIWVSDHHRSDVFVKNSSGKVFRPWITVFADAKSTKVVACIARESEPNATVIKQALKIGINEYGIPEEIYTDNGKDYTSKELSPDNDNSVLNMLGINAIRALPYHGQAKPVERFFRTLEERFGVCFYSYAGHDAKNRPEHMAKLSKELEKDPNLPTFDVFKERLANYIKEYNTSPHSGKGMDGKSPDEIYYNSITQPIRMIENYDILRILCGKRIERKVTNGGIKIFCNIFQNYKGKLFAYLNKKVAIIYDPDDMEKVYIYTLDGEFICQAEAKFHSPFRNLGEENYIKAAKERKQVRKLLKEYEPKRLRDEADILFAQVAEEHINEIKQSELVENAHTKEAKKAVSEQEKENFNPYSSMYDTFKKKGVI